MVVPPEVPRGVESVPLVHLYVSAVPLFKFGIEKVQLLLFFTVTLTGFTPVDGHVTDVGGVGLVGVVGLLGVAVVLPLLSESPPQAVKPKTALNNNPLINLFFIYSFSNKTLVD